MLASLVGQAKIWTVVAHFLEGSQVFSIQAVHVRR